MHRATGRPTKELDVYFVVLAPNDIHLKGHRIGVETILYEYLHRGQMPEAIAEAFDTLTLEGVYATILYYHRNRQHLDEYLDNWLKGQEAARQAQANDPVVQESRRRLRAIRFQLLQRANLSA